LNLNAGPDLNVEGVFLRNSAGACFTSLCTGFDCPGLFIDAGGGAIRWWSFSTRHSLACFGRGRDLTGFFIDIDGSGNIRA